MDILRKLQDPTLVCTCSDLYVNDIIDAVEAGEDEYGEIFQYLYTQPRCGECQCHVEYIARNVENENEAPYDNAYELAIAV